MRIVILLAALGLLAAQGAGAAGIPTVLHISSHLAQTAGASLDGKPAVAAPGYSSTDVPVKAGRHVLKVTTAAGAAYQTKLDLKAANLMTWHGQGYWCVNLLAASLEVYSKEDCQEEVTDAG
jgi:hypothetical protein